jgi:cytochrome c oxidase subunit II
MSEHHDDPAPGQAHTPEGEHGPSPTAAPDPMAVGEMIHVDRYEGAWMRLSLVVLVIFFVSITVAALGGGFQIPGAYAEIMPDQIYAPGSPFADPQVRELAPGKYEAYVRAQMWQFTPNEIHVPVGSEVTFYVTSQDVQHGFRIMGTNVNMMVLPGQISTLSTTFDTPGTYNFICHEYCGQLHQTMYGKLIVEEPSAEPAAAH